MGDSRLEQLLRGGRRLLGDLFHASQHHHAALQGQQLVEGDVHVGQHALLTGCQFLLQPLHLVLRDGPIERQFLAAQKHLFDKSTLLACSAFIADLAGHVTDRGIGRQPDLQPVPASRLQQPRCFGDRGMDL